MKKLLFLVIVTINLQAQVDSPDSLQKALEKAPTEEARVDLINKLSHFYSQFSLESAEQLAQEALERAEAIDYQKGIAASYNNLGICHAIRGDYTQGLDYFITALRIREEENDLLNVSHTLNNIARLFTYQKDFEKALEYSKKSIEVLQKIDDPRAVGLAHIALGSIYLSKDDNVQATKMFTEARTIFAEKNLKVEEGWALMKIANTLESEGKYEEALESCFSAMNFLDLKSDLFTAIEMYETIGTIYSKMGNQKEASSYLHQAIRLADDRNDSNGRMSARLKLSGMFKRFKQYDSALYYNEAYQVLNSEIFNSERSRQLAALEKIYQSEKKDRLLELKNQEIRSQSIIISIISALLLVLTILGFIIYRYYHDKKQSIETLENLNKEISDKHEEILSQSEDLAKANKEISRMNESLELEVTQRTKKIETQSRLLIEYAYSNAHNVRAPLARILGLSMLMANETSVIRIKEYNERMHESALELDVVIREMTNRLQEEKH
jgi:tetratricopeptide (TPR) repeat protein